MIAGRRVPGSIVSAPPRRERGVVLFVALIVMVVMSLAGLALIRSIDTANLVIGNLAFRQSSILAANFAIEDAGTGLFSDTDPAAVGQIVAKCGATALTTGCAAWNYFSTYQKSDDPRGIPAQLQKVGNFTQARVLNDGTDNTIRYVIERMCNAAAQPPVGPGADGSATGTWCDMMPPKSGFGDTVNDQQPINIPPVPLYRVTIRVDGPTKTRAVSFVQATLR